MNYSKQDLTLYKLSHPGQSNSYYFFNIATKYNIENNIFVFGSNEKGYHGAGAAKEALEKYGAILNKAFGLQGNSFGICTKDIYLRPLSLDQICYYIQQFVLFTQQNPHLTFYVTPVGTGYAGYKHEVIAPLFRGAQNCWFPHIWQRYIG